MVLARVIWSFSPNGKHAYVTAEMRSEIVTFNVQDGHLKSG